MTHPPPALRDGHGIAVRIGRDFPRWLILWGAYSREYWAYPCFRVPPGTVLHSPDPGELAGQMTMIQGLSTGKRSLSI